MMFFYLFLLAAVAAAQPQKTHNSAPALQQVPSIPTPAVNTIRIGNVGNKLACKDSSGGDCMPAAGGGGGGSYTVSVNAAPWSPFGEFSATNGMAMEANKAYLFSVAVPVADSFNTACVSLAALAAGKKLVFGFYEKGVGTNDLALRASTGPFNADTTDTDTAQCGTFASGAYVTGSVAALPVSNRLVMAICSDGTPQLRVNVVRLDLRYNRWPTLAKKVHGASANGCTGSGGSLALQPTIAAASWGWEYSLRAPDLYLVFE